MTELVAANPRGIPRAPFVEDVVNFLKPSEVESTLAKFQEMIGKYKFMEVNLLQRKKSLEEKIPEIKKSLDMVTFLDEQKKGCDTLYELSDTLWAKATLTPQESVYLWLGVPSYSLDSHPLSANVMLEYSLVDASALLKEKLEKGSLSMIEVCEDLSFLREQITTMEVNTARVYNWDVKLRRK